MFSTQGEDPDSRRLHSPDADDPVVIDTEGRRCVHIAGARGYVVIDPAVWDRLHARNASLSDRQLLELYHDDFAHGMLAAMKARPQETPVVVGLSDMRMRADG